MGFPGQDLSAAVCRTISGQAVAGAVFLPADSRVTEIKPAFTGPAGFWWSLKAYWHQTATGPGT